jgi:phage terminase large subunit
LQVLENAYDGFNCSLFAYGQTGAGKSYSMVGYGVNKGIIPLVSDSIFVRIDKNTNPDVTFEIVVSMIEIYNERVFDLFVDAKKRDERGLKIREHPKNGPYVEGKEEKLVSC